jgi:hypothetical protein
MDDEEPDHDNGSPTGTLVVWPIVREASNYGSDDEMAGCHTDSTGDKDGLTAPAVDVHDRRDYCVLARTFQGEQMNDLLVAMNMTIPTTPVASRLTEFELNPRPLKMVGA